jgi:hypothetical protein
MRLALTMALIASAAVASADEVWLKGGGRLVGDVIEKRPGSVVLDVGPGTVTLPLSRVERIVSSTVALTEYRARAERISRTDVAGWTALAVWAEENDLRTQSREAWHRVLAAEPGNAVAHTALGDTFYQGRWLDFAAAQRARGLVEWNGIWVTPAEREASIQRDAAEAGARQQAAIAESQRQEAEARVREAEARARAAEAEAARAEADASSGGGIPLGYDGIGGPVIVGPAIQPCCGQRHAPGACPNGGGSGHGHGRPHVQPTPIPPTPTRDEGGRSRNVAPSKPQARGGDQAKER